MKIACFACDSHSLRLVDSGSELLFLIILSPSLVGVTVVRMNKFNQLIKQEIAYTIDRFVSIQFN